MESTRFDVIVVGAGPSGASAAYVLAKRGFKVLLLEKARIPGSKNVYGGRVYLGLLREIYPELEREAPIERMVSKERISIVRGGDIVTLDVDLERSTSFTAYLSELSNWMSSKAEEAGAIMVTEVRVDKILVDRGRVVGVEAGGEEVRGEYVVVGEGINRLLLERAGIVEKLKPEHVGLGLKETIKLSKEKIDETFNLEDGEGLAWIFIGDFTGGVCGGGFLYTNSETVSLGVTLRLGSAREKLRRPIYHVVENLRCQPKISKLLKGGELLEYSAKIVPETPEKLIPRKLYGRGWVIVGDAAGFTSNLGYTIRGVDLAAYSGYLAAKALEEAHGEGSEEPSTYEEFILKSPILKEVRRFKKVSKLLEYDRIFVEYPELILDALNKMYGIEAETPTLLQALNAARKGRVGLLTLIRDIYRLVSSI